MTEAGLLTSWATLLLDSFAAAGVRLVVLSPGSRSTPFTAAALRHPDLRCVTVVDERAAAFFALGHGKATGMPALLICTSGTAGANYFPAVVEAGQAYAPLLVLTADRPPELAQAHAPQTIDQVKLFGDQARAFFELGLPDPDPGALKALRRKAAQAVSLTRSPTPGAVHLNARARKPLEPIPPGADDQAVGERVAKLLATPISRPAHPRLVPDVGTVRRLAEACRESRRGLVVCGPAPLSQGGCREAVAELARRTGFPVLVEAGSQLRFGLEEDDVVQVGALDALGRSATVRERLAPDLVLQLGAPPVAAGWSRYLEAHPDCRRIVIAPHGWNDPWSSAQDLVLAEVGATLEALAAELPASETGGSPWSRAWQAAERAARGAVDEVLEEAGGELTEGGVARAVVQALPEGALLGLGNSLPIRQADGYAFPSPRVLNVFHQRGASGIDGVIAGAAGAARALCVPGALLIGDLSFLHGLGGLPCLRLLGTPFALVVVNNDGGRIFEQLPVAQVPELQGDALEAWTTPHGLDLEPAARLFQLPYRRAEKVPDLEEALHEALGRAGATVIEAKVPPHGAVEQNRRLWQLTERRARKEVPAP